MSAYADKARLRAQRTSSQLCKGFLAHREAQQLLSFMVIQHASYNSLVQGRCKTRQLSATRHQGPLSSLSAGSCPQLAIGIQRLQIGRQNAVSAPARAAAKPLLALSRSRTATAPAPVSSGTALDQGQPTLYTEFEVQRDTYGDLRQPSTQGSIGLHADGKVPTWQLPGLPPRSTTPPQLHVTAVSTAEGPSHPSAPVTAGDPETRGSRSFNAAAAPPPLLDPSTARRVTRLLSSSNTWQEVSEVVQRYGTHALNDIHLAAALTRMAKLELPGPEQAQPQPPAPAPPTPSPAPQPDVMLQGGPSAAASPSPAGVTSRTGSAGPYGPSAALAAALAPQSRSGPPPVLGLGALAAPRFGPAAVVASAGSGGRGAARPLALTPLAAVAAQHSGKRDGPSRTDTPPPPVAPPPGEAVVVVVQLMERLAGRCAGTGGPGGVTGKTSSHAAGRALGPRAGPDGAAAGAGAPVLRTARDASERSPGAVQLGYKSAQSTGRGPGAAAGVLAAGQEGPAAVPGDAGSFEDLMSWAHSVGGGGNAGGVGATAVNGREAGIRVGDAVCGGETRRGAGDTAVGAGAAGHGGGAGGRAAPDARVIANGLWASTQLYLWLRSRACHRLQQLRRVAATGGQGFVGPEGLGPKAALEREARLAQEARAAEARARRALGVLLRAAAEAADRFEGQHVSNALHCTALLAAEAPGVLQQLLVADEVVGADGGDGGDGRELQQVVEGDAAGTGDSWNEPGGAGKKTGGRGSSGDGEGWGGEAGMRLEQLLACLLGAARRQMDDLGPQALSNSIHALATLQHLGALRPADGPRHDNAQLANGSRSSTESNGGGFTPDQQRLQPRADDAAAGLRLGPWLDAWAHASAAQLPRFQPQHLANSLWALARLGHHPGRRWLGRALEATEQQRQGFTPQGLCNALWALAQLRFAPSGPRAEEEAAQLAALCRTLAAALAAGGGGAADVASGLVAAARLHELLPPSLDRPAQTPPLDGLEAGDGGAADTQFTADVKTGAGTEAHDGPAAARHALRSLGSYLLRRSEQRLLDYSPQQLANTAWAAAALGLPPPAGWSASYWPATAAVLPSMRDEELVAAATAVVKLRMQPPPEWQAAVMRVVGQAVRQRRRGRRGRAQQGPQELEAAVSGGEQAGGVGAGLEVRVSPTPRVLSSALWCAAAWGTELPAAWTAAVLSELEAAAGRGELGAAELATCLYALGRMWLQPDRLLGGWLGRVVGACVETWSRQWEEEQAQQGGGDAGGVPVQGCNASNARQVLWGCARLRAESLDERHGAWLALVAAGLDPTYMDAPQARPAVVGGCPGEDPGAVPVVLWALACMGLRPPRGAMVALVTHGSALLPRAGARDLCTLLVALGQLRFRPQQQRFWAGVEARAVQLARDMTGAQVAGVMWSFAQLAHQPGRPAVQVLMARWRQVQKESEGGVGMGEGADGGRNREREDEVRKRMRVACSVLGLRPDGVLARSQGARRRGKVT